ncbi:MAG: AEC family transporter [Acutalibacteraceae bacterium]|jgi:predicted permease
MLVNYLTVAQQVAILFILIALGFICGKTGILTQTVSKHASDLVLLFVTPCVIIHSFQRPFDVKMLKMLGLACLLAFLIHAGAIGLTHLLLHDPDKRRQRVLHVGTVLSNAGFMALPLQQALLGDDGVFFGAAYIAMFNLVLWSYGLLEMSGDRRALSPRKLLINPGVIGLVIGGALFLCSVTLPEILAAPIAHLAAMNTPLPMLIIGFYLSQSNLKAALRDWRGYLAIALRLVVVPLAALGIMWLCGVRGALLVSMVVASSAPVAAATTMFAAKFDGDASLSVNMVSLSTLLSILTMPLVVGLAQTMA